MPSGRFGKAENTDKGSEQWAVAMYPLSKTLIMLQTNLLYDIATHGEIDNPSAAAARTLDILVDWKKWIDANMKKVHAGNLDGALDTLGWEGDAGARHEVRGWGGHTQGGDVRRYETNSRKKSCHAGGINACTTMQCPAFDKKYNCGMQSDPRAWCGGMCYKFHVWNFYWQYLAPKVSKIQDDVQKMIVALGDQAASGRFAKLGRAYCRQGYYDGWKKADAKNLETCAKKCLSEPKCRFFAIMHGHTCSRYDERAGDCSNPISKSDHVLYKLPERTMGIQHYGDGHCNLHSVHASGSWALAGTGRTSYGFTTAQYKSWVKRAWEECLEIDAEITHVAVSDYAAFWCYRTSSCNMKAHSRLKTWTSGHSTPITMQSHGHGHCKTNQVYSSNDWALGDSVTHERNFDSYTYMAWVRQAWLRCLAEDPSTKYVSVWKNAAYRCYNGESCSRDHSSRVQTWSPKPWPTGKKPRSSFVLSTQRIAQTAQKGRALRVWWHMKWHEWNSDEQRSDGSRQGKLKTGPSAPSLRVERSWETSSTMFFLHTFAWQID